MGRTRTSAGIDAAAARKAAKDRAPYLASAVVEIKSVTLRLRALRRAESVIEFPVTRIIIPAGYIGAQTGRRLLADRRRAERLSPQY